MNRILCLSRDNLVNTRNTLRLYACDDFLRSYDAIHIDNRLLQLFMRSRTFIFNSKNYRLTHQENFRLTVYET